MLRDAWTSPLSQAQEQFFGQSIILLHCQWSPKSPLTSELLCNSHIFKALPVLLANKWTFVQFLNDLFLFYMYEYSVCMNVICTTGVLYLWRPEEGARGPEPGITDSQEPPWVSVLCGLFTFVFQKSPFLNFSFPSVSHFHPMTARMLGKNSPPELHQPSRC